MFLDVTKIFLPTIFSFLLGIFITPFATHFFYKYKMWKKKTRTLNTSSEEFKQIHKTKEEKEVSTPCVGGIIIWLSVLTTTLVFFLLAKLFPTESFFKKLDFISRSQTFIPLGIFILGAFLGLFDDLLEITGRSNITRDSRWYTKLKLIIIMLIGLIAGWWFYSKLGMMTVSIPWDGILYLGLWFIPFVIFIMLATFSGGVIDGIDGLSGGVLASIFASYSVIAFLNNQIDLATLCGVITGAILAFLWFNIPPARFYMGETGMMPLTITLATVAFLTNTVLLLPVIAFPLAVTSFSSSAQLISKKYFNKRIFKVAPLHHHFESIGWPAYKVTMRYWVLSIISALLGVILFIISK